MHLSSVITTPATVTEALIGQVLKISILVDFLDYSRNSHNPLMDYINQPVRAREDDGGYAIEPQPHFSHENQQVPISNRNRSNPFRTEYNQSGSNQNTYPRKQDSPNGWQRF